MKSKIIYGILLAGCILSQEVTASGYSNLDHPQSDEIFTRNIIKKSDYDKLLEDMAKARKNLNSFTSYVADELRNDLIDLYARASILDEKTKANHIIDTRSENLLQHVGSFILKFIRANSEGSDTMMSFRKQAAERKKVIESQVIQEKNPLGISEQKSNSLLIDQTETYSPNPIISAN